MTDDDPTLLADLVRADVPSPLIKRVIFALSEYNRLRAFHENALSRQDAPLLEIEEEERKLREEPPSRSLIESCMAKRKNGGRPPVVDWITVEKFVFEKMEENGHFGPDDPSWNAQARLEGAIEEFCRSKFPKVPSVASIRRHLTEILSKWDERQQKQS